jgi:hypothetical protein
VTTNTDVYATDFYAWCLTTAQLVREGQWDAIDPEALAEELESLGRSQKRELESRLEVLLIHLLKWEHQPERREDSHSWYDTILDQRHQIARLLRDNPGLRPPIDDTLLEEVSPDARQRAAAEMGSPYSRRAAVGTHEGLLAARMPQLCPWTPAQVLGTDFWPGP